MGWSPVSGSPETIVSGAPVGAILPRQRIAHDAIVHFGVERAVVERDAGAAVAPFCDGLAEADGNIGLAIALGVLQRDQKSAGRGLVIAVIAAAPGVDVDDPLGATTRCRAWPMLSAKTVAQNPGGSVMPPLSLAQVFASPGAELCHFRGGRRKRAAREHQSDDLKRRRR